MIAATRKNRARDVRGTSFQHSQASRRPAKSRREAPPSPQISNPVVEKAPSRRPEPDEQLSFQGGELR
jgi:hypothetical protein